VTALSIRAITLDLDDTLWPFAPIGQHIEHSLHMWIQAHSPAMAAMYPPTAMRRLREHITAANPQLQHDLGALRRLTFQQALHNSGSDPELLQSLWAVFHAARNQVCFYPDALPALQRISQHVPIVALSNGNADLKQIGIADRFAFQLNAAEFGAAKPDSGIFHAACARLQLPPSQVLHVGDDVELDVRGAMRAGLRGCWINRQAQTWPHREQPDQQFATLSALADWLDHLFY